jgi:hypothetical protein
MLGMKTGLLLGLALLWTLAGCCSPECSPERLPNQGHATTPEVLAAIVQQEAHAECWSPLYDLLSKRTRDEYSRTKWRLGISSLTIPEYGYRVVDVVEKGTFDGAITNPNNPAEAFAYYDYAEPGKKPLHAKVLIRREDASEWRIALQDQIDRIERHDHRYAFFDEPDPK